MTIKQRKFVEEIVKGESGTKAAIKANYSKKTAHSIGCENLSKPIIKKAIESRLLDIKAKTEVTIENIQLKHQKMQEIALEKGDLPTVTANIIAEGRTIGVYSDNLNTIPIDKSELTAEERAELKLQAQRLIDIKLSKAGS